MELKLGELPKAIECVNELLQEKLPIKTAYWIGKTLKKLASESQEFEASRQLLINKYGDKDDQGNLIIENNEYKLTDKKGFNKEYSELAIIEVEVTFTPVEIESLGEIILKGSTLMALIDLGFVLDGEKDD